MSRLIFILGSPGVGKSSSARNLKKEDVGYLTASGKELPYKANFTPVTAKSLAEIKKAVLSSKKPILVIDDINFALQYEISSQRDNSDQWTVYRKLKDDFYDLMITITNKPGNQNIYLMGHIEPDQERVTLRTAGKAISTGATPPEGFTNIVLEAIVDPMDGFVFRVKTDGSGVKSPGFDNDKMFDTDTVPNDLVVVNKAINKYYQGGK